MLKIVYLTCCGINVYKKFVVATIATIGINNITTYKAKQFNTYTNELISLNDLLAITNCVEICMEITRKYCIPVCNILESTCKITLSNQKFTNSFQFNDSKCSI